MQDKLKSGIYCIENINNNKKYIGQSVDILTRWNHHRNMLKSNSHPNKYLQSTWNKYGEESLKFYVLEYSNVEKLDELEIYYINLYNTTNREKGYNMKTGGQNGGSHYTEESRKKMSESQKKYLSNPDNIERLRKQSLDMWKNQEYKQKRCGENHHLYGKHHSEETKKKLSAANKGRISKPVSDETKEKISKANKGKVSKQRNFTPVLCIETNQIFQDAITAGKELNINHPNHVIDVCQGRRKTCGGYHFEFINNKGNNIS